MTNQARKLFVRLWIAEYEAVRLSHKLSEELDTAHRLDKPTKRLECKLRTQERKAISLTKQICENIENGNFPRNAVELCSEQLGYITEYVCDCFADLCLDYE